MIIGIRGTLSDERARGYLPELLQLMRPYPLQVLLSTELARLCPESTQVPEQLPEKNLADHADLIMTLGGDGSILAAARDLTRNIPIFGVHMGTLGYLTAIVPENLPSTLPRLLDGDYIYEDRIRLLARSDAGESVLALNDLVAITRDSARIIHVETFINEERLYEFAGDGVIIATPTGSTAYSLAAGGPVLEPTMRGIIIVPINPHTITVRPIVVGTESRIRLVVNQPGREYLFSADGQHDWVIRDKGSVEISVAPEPIRLIKFTSPGFISVLRDKLNWNVQ